MAVHLSLITCTIGRPDEIQNLARSIAEARSHFELEWIIVDQSGDEKFSTWLHEAHLDFPFQYLKTPKGVARGRNLASQKARGDWLTFPDDDCWYGPDSFQSFVDVVQKIPDAEIVVGKDCLANGSHRSFWKNDLSRELSLKDTIYYSACICLFFKSKVFQELEGFDENFGPGGAFGFLAGADTELLTRAKRKSFKIWYAPELKIYHPPFEPQSDLNRVCKDAEAHGAIYRRNLPFGMALGLLLLPFVRACVNFVIGRRQAARIQWRVGRSRLSGWREFRESLT